MRFTQAESKYYPIDTGTFDQFPERSQKSFDQTPRKVTQMRDTAKIVILIRFYEVHP
jgi:hypothetical protein